MNCKICGTEAETALKHKVRGTHEAQYALCPNCDFMFVVEPTWLAEAYQNPINITDTGYVTRNIYLARKSLILFTLLFSAKGTYLDYAAGYGMLVRIMRDYGLDFLWDDIYVKNLFAQGFEYKKEENLKIQAVTCFECFEHLPEPLEALREMLSISDTIFFSTRLKNTGLPPEDWEYYGFNHGQHVAFYSKKTLEFMARKYNLNVYTDGENLHILSKSKLPSGIVKTVNLLTKLQADIFLRKLFKSKTIEDHDKLKSLGF
jgi:hypothetical protein